MPNNGSDDLDRIIEGDVLAGLAGLPDRSVDLVMTSPPYADARARQYGGVPADQYVDWYRPIARELLRVLRKSGSYVLNIKEGRVDGERSEYCMDLVRMHRREGWRWHEEFVWHKVNAVPGRWPAHLRDEWEHCYQFARAAHPWMDKAAVARPAAAATALSRDYWGRRVQRQGDVAMRILGGRPPPRTGSGLSVRKINTLHGPATVEAGTVLYGAVDGSHVAAGERALHSASFPVWLPAWFIRLLCPPQGTVLDPFLGSGTTAVAAESEGRHWIGIDRSAEYCRMAADRIALARAKRSTRR